MDGNNITHMKLFYQLKQKFPDVKDDDVNESIQKFGLNREQCEVDLQQKCLVHHGGYYGPWGRHTANNSEASSAVTSPQRELGTLSPSLITSENSPVTTIHNTTAFHYIDAPGNMGTVNDRTITPRAMFTHCGGDWHPAITCQNEIMSPSKDINQLQLYIDQKHIQRTADVPATAPIISAGYKPFNPFPNEPTHTRRWSQESGCDVSKDLLHQQFDNLAIRHSICTEQDVKDLEKTTTSPKDRPAIVHEQLQHKEKLEEEIAASTNEKMKLASDLTKLERDIILKEQQRKEAANINRKKIEEIQEHNQKLQYACDQMEAEIIQFGETPDTEQDCFTNVSQTTQLITPSSTATPSPLNNTRDSPLSTISSESNTPVSAAPMPSFISSRVPSTTQPTSLPANHQSIYGRPSNENSVPETSSNHADRPNTSTNSQACWNCSKCTYDNITDLHVCEMCGFPRYNLGTDHSNTRASPQDKNGGSVPCYCRRHRHYCRESTGYS